MAETYVYGFGELAPGELAEAGGKGGNLARMCQAGFPVPEGFVILPAAFADESLTSAAWQQVRVHLDRLRSQDPIDPAVAVRSSALGEDSEQASFAGEFESVLNVESDDDVRRAIETVHASRLGERVKEYSRSKGLEAPRKLAVVVQCLVPADASGVLFTADPVTGRRDRLVLSAAWGLGEAVVQGTVTPDTLVIDKRTNKVLRCDIADKQLMSVRLDGGGTGEQPVSTDRRRLPVLSDEQAATLVSLGTRLETFYGLPLDIEWALAGDTFSILQARPITALPSPEPLPPETWELPEGKYMAMRNNIVELMIDPLTPLFETLGLAAVNSSMSRAFKEFMGRSGLMPEPPIIAVNHYAYYDGSLTAGQILRILAGSVSIARRMFSGAVSRWTDEGRPRYVAVVEEAKAHDWDRSTASELVAAAYELTEAAIDAYVSLVSGVIPAAWISEGLFTAAYRLLARRHGGPAAPVFLMGYDSVPILAEKSLYDIARWAGATPALADYLSRTPARILADGLTSERVPEGPDAPTWREWQRQFRGYLETYGHTVYNLDFANPVPADDPTPLLETVKLFLGPGADPYERQQAAARRREEAVRAVKERLGGLRLRLFSRTLKSAQRYAPLREDGLADVGLAYPLLRRLLLEAGSRLANTGVVEDAADVFWLTSAELEEVAADLDRGEPVDDLSRVVAQRVAEWRAARRTDPPRVLMRFNLFGREFSWAQRSHARGDQILARGVGASPGTVTARACVLHGPRDFTAMQTGDVLVASITTPAWTPLFARAAAVVTDVGGPLSHGSIVAREYGIPAVLGTGDATRRIKNGQLVTVDGTAGTVTVASTE